MLPGSFEAMRAKAGKHAVHLVPEAAAPGSRGSGPLPGRNGTRQPRPWRPAGLRSGATAHRVEMPPVDWRHPTWHLPKCRHPKHRPCTTVQAVPAPPAWKIVAGTSNPVSNQEPQHSGIAPFAGGRTGCGRFQQRTRPRQAGPLNHLHPMDGTMCPMYTNSTRSPHRGAKGPGTMQRNRNSTPECPTSRPDSSSESAPRAPVNSGWHSNRVPGPSPRSGLHRLPGRTPGSPAGESIRP